MEVAQSRITILSLGVDSLAPQKALDVATQMMSNQEGRSYHLVTANPEMVMAAYKDTELAKVINDASLVLPDGVGLIWASRILGQPLPGRIPGIDLVRELLKKAEALGLKVYFLGAKPGVAEKATARLKETMPNLQVVGYHHGYFTAEEEEGILKELNRLNPHLILVALGVSRQEKWIAKVKDGLKVNLMIGVGGSLDVFAGRIKRAPLFWQRVGLEWLYRLIQQPSRLKRVGALPAFVMKVLAQKSGVSK